MAFAPPKTRFHHLIEQAVDEYERLQLSAGKIHQPGERPKRAWAPQDGLHPDLESVGIRFTGEEDQPGEGPAQGDESYLLPSAEVEAHELPADSMDQSSLAMKWWHLMVSLTSWQETFVLRDCWLDSKEASESADSNRSTPRRSSVGRPSLFRTMTSKVRLVNSGSSVEENDIVRRVWLERPPSSLRGFSKSQEDVLDRRGARRCMMHPFSMKRILWLSLGMVFLLLEVFLFTMSAFGLQRLPWFDIVSAQYWSCDIVASFCSGVSVNGNLEMNPCRVAKRYFASWFGVDLLVVGYQWFMIILDGGSATSSAAVLRYIKLVRHVKLLRLLKFDYMMSQVLRRIRSLWVLLCVRMILCLLAVFMWVHISATAWYWIGTMHEIGWASQEEQFTMPWVNYFVSVHWAASQLQGNVDIYPVLPVERAFASCQLLASVIALALLVSKLTTVMQEMQEASVAERRLQHASQMYLHEHGISSELSFSVKTYIQRKQVVDAKHNHNRDEIELLRVLPAELRRRLLEEARGPLLAAHLLFSAFKQCNTRFFERLCCDLLRSAIVQPDSYIFSVGVRCPNVHFVVAGETTYFAYTKVVSALMSGSAGMTSKRNTHLTRHRTKLHRAVPEGTCLCEPALWVRWVHRGDFDARSQTSLLLLEVSAFDDLVSSYLTVKLSMREHAVRWLMKLSQTESLTDLLSSADVLQSDLGS